MADLDIVHTFAEWRKIWETLTGGRIHDPDGFREKKGGSLAHIDPSKTYTLGEFSQRITQCTITRGSQQ